MAKETRYQNSDYKMIGEKCIETFPELQPLKNTDLRIAYLGSDKEYMSKGRIIFAQCEKVPDKWKWCVPYDFVITVYEPNCTWFDTEQMIILMRHELNHIGYEKEDGEQAFFVRPHDIEDFRHIIETYGMDWDKAR